MDSKWIKLMTSDTAHLLIFIRGTDATLMVHEELGGLCSLKGTTTGEDFLKVPEVLSSLELIWKKIKNVISDWQGELVGHLWF